jgi:hypothetical protein
MQPTSWRSTVCGLVAALAAFVVINPDLFAVWPWILSLAKYIMVGGLAGIGIAARDAGVHYTPPDTLQAIAEAKQKEGLQIVADEKKAG